MQREAVDNVFDRLEDWIGERKEGRRRHGGIAKRLKTLALVLFVVNLTGILLLIGGITWMITFVLQLMGVLS